MEDFKPHNNELISGESAHNFEGYEKREFSVWKRIRIGTGEKSGEEFISILKNKGFLTSSKEVDSIVKEIQCEPSPEELDLVRVTPADLGFKEMSSLKAINARAQELGLNLCPAEVGPRLRLEYKDQSKDDWIYIGMEPIISSEGYPIIFAIVEEEGGLYLHSNYNSEVQVYGLDKSFVYLKGNKKYYDYDPIISES